MIKRPITVILAGVLVAIAAGCDYIAMNPGDGGSSTCPVGQTASWVELDGPGSLAVRCSGSGDPIAVYDCVNGFAEAISTDARTVTVTCNTVNVPGTEVQQIYDFAGTGTQTTTEPGAVTAMALASTYCSGGKGWQASTTYSDRAGRLPDYSWNGLNWRITATVTWCVKNGVVTTGLSFVETVQDGRMRELNNVVFSATPAGVSSRTINADWDFMYGFCPWCAEIDVDLRFTVRASGAYSLTWTNNGDGY